MYKYLLLLTILPLITGKLVIFQYKTNNIDNYIKYFKYIDKDIEILGPKFTDSDFKQAAKNATGFIIPGGSSNVFNEKSKLWDYVNRVFDENKPIVGICNGFHHILKKLDKDHQFKFCNIKTNLIIDGKIHNHKLCSDNFLSHQLDDHFTTFKYKNATYLETFSDKNIYATVYHPEKTMQCNNRFNNCKRLNDIAFEDIVKFTKALYKD